MTGEDRPAALCPLPHKHRGPEEQPCTRCEAADRLKRNCPRRLPVSSVVCIGHLVGLQQQLQELPGLYADLLVAERRGGKQPKTKLSGHSEVCVSEPAADTRRLIRTVLASWVQYVASEVRSTRLPPDTVEAMADWLVGRVESWIRGQPYCTTMVTAIAELHRNATRIAHPRGDPVIPVGPCLQQTASDVATRLPQQCDGTMRATLGHDPPLPLACDTCGHQVPPGMAHRLARAYGRRQLLTGDDAILAFAARGVTVNAGTLRQWAHRGRIRSYPHPDGRARYDMDTLSGEAS